jgi:uncharacterized protein (DUF2336 family)
MNQTSGGPRGLVKMNASLSLSLELEDAIAGSDVRRRAVMLRRMADLFVGSGDLTSQQTFVFDDVMSRLLAEVESSAKVQLSEYLVEYPHQARKTIRSLALDDVIEVARPMLTRSDQLEQRTLEEAAATKSQAHLLAISSRKTVPEPVTEILVDRGDRDVVLCVAGNPGARFSAFGFSSLVLRSSQDEELAAAVWIRSDVPRRHLLKLFSDASLVVKDRLCKEDPAKGKAIEKLVARAMDQLQTQTRQFSPEFRTSSAFVKLLEQAGRLDESALREFATAKQFSESVLTLSSICDVPAGVVERALVDDRSEQILVLAKAAGLNWDTTKALLVLKYSHHETRGDLERLFEIFLRLRSQTARKAVQFYKLRQRALAPDGAQAP